MIEPEDYRAYYDVIANQTLWFCLHGLWDLPRRPRFDRHWWAAWERFRAVNEQFAAAAAEAAAPGGDGAGAGLPAGAGAGDAGRPAAGSAHARRSCTRRGARRRSWRRCPTAVASELLAGLAGGGAVRASTRPGGPRRSRRAAASGWAGRRSTFVSPAAPDVDDLRSVAASPACERGAGPA